MATELAERILAAALPGLELVESDPAPVGTDQLATAPKATAPKPGLSLAQLRAKYLGYAADAGPARNSAAAPEHVEVHQVRPRVGHPAPIGNRTFIFSEKGLVGAQG